MKGKTLVEWRCERRSSPHGAVRTVSIMTMAVLSAVLFLFSLAAGCSASTPQRAVGDFVSARIAGDDARAAELTVEQDVSDYIGGEPFLYASDVSFEIEQTEERVDEDRAVVMVRYTWADQSVELPYVCLRVGSKWKVALRETEEMWFPEIEMEEESFSL